MGLHPLVCGGVVSVVGACEGGDLVVGWWSAWALKNYVITCVVTYTL